MPGLSVDAASAADAAPERPRIYQLFLRQFSNVNETRKPHGTLAENGVGGFADLDDRALCSLRELGVTPLWLMGMLRPATATDYSAIGLPADDPDLLKGLAGSPYALRDYFDVCPDYATDPTRRLEEFRALVDRIHRNRLRLSLDFVPNHVARSLSSVVKPELSFGVHDNRGMFFAPSNHFYYLPGALRLPTVKDGQPVSPTCKVTGGGDGAFAGEAEWSRVTGNNGVTNGPNAGDWHETVKLNYGFDFTLGRHGPKGFPTDDHPGKPIPDTWLKMDAVLAHWQQLGVDGFRCDMAYWVPLEFWRWAIGRARARQANVFFVAEAYDNDPNKLTDGNVLKALVAAGFEAVYDDQSYDILTDIHDGPEGANDLDVVLGAVAPLHQSLRYAENHDEVRLANPQHWSGIGTAVGRPVTALLFAFGRGPVLLYNGQEVGEPALGAKGFGGDDGRTSIFDCWSMPELAKWVNGHRYDGEALSGEQRALRSWYARLLRTVRHPALARGEFLPLNGANRDNPRFGRLPGETASGHWLYAFLRHVPGGNQAILVVANLHGREPLPDVNLRFSGEALAALDANHADGPLELRDLLANDLALRFRTGTKQLREAGLTLGDLPPLGAWYLEAQWQR
jgi:glycosidase